MPLGGLVKPELIFTDLPGTDRPAVLRALSDGVAERSAVPDADELYHGLWEREELGSTCVRPGVAIPHCKLRNLERPVVALGLCASEIDFDAEDGEPVRLLFLLVSPHNSAAEHLQSLAAISRWIQTPGNVERLGELRDVDEIYDLLTAPEAAPA